MNDILLDKNLTSDIVDSRVVSKDCFRSGHPLSIFRYLHCAAGSRFDNLFQKYDIFIKNDEDIFNLASISEKGIDIKNFNANFLEIAKGLVLTDKEIGRAQCLNFC